MRDAENRKLMLDVCEGLEKLYFWHVIVIQVSFIFLLIIILLLYFLRLHSTHLNEKFPNKLSNH